MKHHFNGIYKIYYKERSNDKIKSFTGLCENFNTMGLSAFYNAEEDIILLVDYKDIVQMYPL